MADLSIKLSDKELIYLLEEFDGDIFPGITDPFEDMSESEKMDAVLEAEESLQDRGYRKRMFGGRTEYDENLSSIIKICATFEKYIGFDERNDSKILTTERFYMSKGKWVQISGGPEIFTLAERDSDYIDSFLNKVPKDTGSKSNEITILMPLEQYEDVVNLVQEGQIDVAKEKLKSLNLDDFNEKFLIDGLSYNIRYAAITVVNRNESNISVDCVATLISDDAMAELYSVAGEGDIQMVGFRPVTAGSWIKIKEVIKEWLTE